MHHSLHVLTGPSIIWITVPSPRVPGEFTCTTSQVPEFLDGAGDVLRLISTIRFRFGDHPDPERHGERKVVTLDYAHSIYDICPDTGREREQFAWHWHPSIQDYDFPHAHVGKGMSGPLGRLHLPTGRVALEQILLFMICDLGVEPYGPPDQHAGGIRTLNETLARFTSWASWR